MKALHLISRWLMYVAGAALAVMNLFVVLSVVMRYGLRSPFRFTEEFVGLLFASTFFLVLPLCFLSDKNIRMTIILDRLPQRLRRFLEGIGTLLCLVFTAIYGWHTFQFMAQSYRLGARTEMGELIMWPWMLLLPASMLLVAVVLVARSLPGLFGRLEEDNMPGGGLH